MLSSPSSSFSSSIDLRQPLVCLIPLLLLLLLLLLLSLLALRRLLLPQAAASGEPHGCPGQRLKSRCAICLEDIFCDEEKLRVLPECGHGFHAECVNRWLKCRRSCPLCRRAVAGHRRSIRERVMAAVLSSFCQWMDSQFDSDLTLVFCQNL